MRAEFENENHNSRKSAETSEAPGSIDRQRRLAIVRQPGLLAGPGRPDQAPLEIPGDVHRHDRARQRSQQRALLRGAGDLQGVVRTHEIQHDVPSVSK